MGVLTDALLAADKRPQVIADCAKLVDDEVAGKSGVSGILIKAGYKAFTALKPTMVPHAVDALLNDFVRVLDRHYDKYCGDYPDKAKSFDAWATARDQEIAGDLLGITDDIMSRSSKIAIQKIYARLRHVAQRNVSAAVPAVALTID